MRNQKVLLPYDQIVSIEQSNEIGPIHDFTTTNRSAVAMHFVLKKLKVKNNKFHLVLYDSGLANIDPYADDLPQEFQDRVLMECLRNPMYVLRELSFAKTSGGSIQNVYTIANLSMLYLYFNNINYMIQIPRQLSKTGSQAMFMAASFNFGRYTMMSMTHHVLVDAMKNLSRVADCIDMYPTYLNFQREFNANGTIKDRRVTPVADFDGCNLYVSKQLPDGVDALVMVNGSHTSVFALRDVMNFDKIPGVQAYAMSLEMDEGTGR